MIDKVRDRRNRESFVSVSALLYVTSQEMGKSF
jgi:hypothetical protein